MAPGFRTTYPIVAFDGGLNNKYEPNAVSDIESPDALNVIYDERGGPQTRDGSKIFNTTAVGTNAANSLTRGDGLFTYRQNDGTEIMLGWWNGTMYRMTGTSTFVTVPSAQSVYTAGERVDMAVYQNLAFFGNGGSKPYKYNGTEFTRHGIPAPNSTAVHTSGVASTGGGATGDIQYKFTYVNSYAVEGDVSPATATLTVASTASVSLTAIPLAPTSFGVASRKIYRKDSSSGGNYKLVATLADNTTTTYLDGIAPAALGANAPTDQGEPPRWKFVKSHQERLFMSDPANPQYGYYTELGNPFVVKTTNYQKIQDGDGENITAISVHANAVVWGKDASAWILYMPDTDPTNWLCIKTNSKYGYASHYATADFSQLQMFLGKRYGNVAGFFALAGTDTQPNAVDLPATSIHSDSYSDRIEPDIFLLTRANVNRASAIEFQNKLWFSVPYNASQINSRIYQFDYQRRDKDRKTGSFVPFTYPVGFECFTVYNGILYGQCSTSTGQVWQLSGANQYKDHTSAINSYQYTKEFPGFEEHQEHQKDFRFLNMIVETLGVYYMNVGYLVDGDSGVPTTVQVYLAPGANVWGSMIWGTDIWGGGRSRANVRVALSPKAGKRIQFKFDNQNTVNQGFHVYSNANFIYNLRGKR